MTDDLRRPPWRGDPNPLKGHCYVAAEALRTLIGGKPCTVRHEGAVHWYLVVDGEVVDPTAGQFQTPVPYEKGRGRGFLTAAPSKRARELLRRLALLDEHPRLRYEVAWPSSETARDAACPTPAPVSSVRRTTQKRACCGPRSATSSSRSQSGTFEGAQ